MLWLFEVNQRLNDLIFQQPNSIPGTNDSGKRFVPSPPNLYGLLLAETMYNVAPCAAGDETIQNKQCLDCGCREYPLLNLAHQLICLLCQTEGQNGVGQDSGKVGEESLVNSQNTFGPHGLRETIQYTFIQVAILVIQSRHDGIWWMHDTTDHKSTACAAC